MTSFWEFLKAPISLDHTAVLRIKILNTTVGSIASSFKTITTTMADLQPQTQGLPSTSTSTLETEVNNLLENIVNMYKCVNPRLVAIKLDKGRVTVLYYKWPTFTVKNRL